MITYLQINRPQKRSAICQGTRILPFTKFYSRRGKFLFMGIMVSEWTGFCTDFHCFAAEKVLDKANREIRKCNVSSWNYFDNV